MKALYEHQRAIIETDPRRTGLFLGTGSGKTRTALMLARGRTLVICPKTQYEDKNWEREYKQMHGRIEGGRITSEGNLVVDYRIESLTVISKETFRRDHATLSRFDTVIVDEAHTCLGVTPNTRQRKRQIIPRASQLYETLYAFLERTSPERLYLCTATIMRSPMTVWAASQLLGHSLDFYEWRKTYYTQLPMPGREVYAPRTDSDTKDRLAAVVRSLGHVGRLEDFFDVPDQTFKTDHVALTPKQTARIRALRTEFPDPIVQIGKRHQVENGVLSGDEFNALEVFDNGKIDKILEYALEFPRMVVFAKYRAQIDAIHTAVTKAGHKAWTLTGDTKDRGALLAQANAAPSGVFIAQAQISAGWELPTYPVMIFASRTYSFVDEDQAIGRIHRANALKKNLYIRLVVKGGIDEAVDKSLANKQDFNERLYSGV